MSAKLALVASFVAIAFVYNAAYLGVVAICARALRLGAAKYVLGTGPLLVQRGAWTLRAFPLNAYFDAAFRAAPVPVEPESALGRALDRGQARWLDDLPLSARALLASMPVLVGAFAASILLGPIAAGRASLNGLLGYLSGALGPLTEAPRLLDAALARWNASTPFTAVGHATALIAGLNLLLLPDNAMFMLAVSTKKLGWLKARLFVLLAMLLLITAWIVGVIVWIARNTAAS